jgi:hypothetical protein
LEIDIHCNVRYYATGIISDIIDSRAGNILQQYPPNGREILDIIAKKPFVT